MRTGRDDTTAGLIKRLVESTAGTVDWSKARAILEVSSREEAVELLAQAIARAREEIIKTKAAMALLVQTQSEQAIVITDPLGLVVSVTPKGAKLLGWPVGDVVGRPIDLMLADRLNAATDSATEMKSADSGEGVFSEREHVRQDGTTFNAHHAVFALIGTGGYMSGFVRRIEDVTARKAFEVRIEELDATIALLVG